jgi:hypothetical protein
VASTARLSSMYARSHARGRRTAAFLVASLAWASAHAELRPEELAKIAQIPVGNLVSVPFQENAYFNVGPLVRCTTRH